MADTVTVLDLGGSKAVCITARLNSGVVEPLAVASVDCRGIRRGAVHNAEHATVSAAEAIRKNEVALGSPVGEIYCSIGSHDAAGKTGQGFTPIIPAGRLVSRDDVLKVINHSRKTAVPPGCEQIQAVARLFRVDGGPGASQPIGLPGSRLEVETYLVYAPTTVVDQLENIIHATGHDAAGFVPSALCSGLGTASGHELAQGVAVIDIGHSHTDIAVFSEGSLAHHAAIPIGSSHVDADVAQLVKTEQAEACRLKLESGCAIAKSVDADELIQVLQMGHDQPRPMQRRVFCEIIESRMREIARLAKAEIDRSGHRASLHAGVVLTGGGSQLPGTAELFAKQLEIAKVGLGLPRVTGELKATTERPEYAAAVGLARFALDEDELGVSGSEGSWRDRIRTLWSLFAGDR